MLIVGSSLLESHRPEPEEQEKGAAQEEEGAADHERDRYLRQFGRFYTSWFSKGYPLPYGRVRACMWAVAPAGSLLHDARSNPIQSNRNARHF